MQSEDLKFIQAHIRKYLNAWNHKDEIENKFFRDEMNLISEYGWLVHKSYKTVFTRTMIEDILIAKEKTFFCVGVEILEKVDHNITNHLNEIAERNKRIREDDSD